MIPLLVALVLAQPNDPYVRTRGTDGDSKSSCLYWSEGSEIVFRSNVAGNPATPGDTEFGAIARSFDSWGAQMAACGSLTFREGSRTGNRTIGNDGENVVLFRQKRCTDLLAAADPCWKAGACGSLYDCWAYSTQSLAVTTTTFRPNSGLILDADIEFNSSNFLFTTVDLPPCPPGATSANCVASDIQNTATHEIGHMLGLSHTSLAGSTMNASASPGELVKRTLDPGTKAFVCETYPPGRAAQNCVLRPFGLSASYVQELGKEKGGCGCAAGEPLLPCLAMVLALRRRRRGARG